MAVIEATPTLLHKNLSVSGIKVLDNEQGIVEAYVAGIGNKDSSGDIIQPGAFDDSLRVRTPKGVWSHDWSIWVSKTLDAHQVLPGDPSLPLKMASRGVGGMYVKTQFNLNTQAGRDAFENVKFFDEESEWSIGYMEVETEYSKDLQANLLIKIDWYEYSPVLFGANNLTSTVSIKVEHVEDDYQVQISGLGNRDLEAQVSKAVKDTLAGAVKEKTDEAVQATTDAVAEEVSEEKVVPGSFEARYGAVVEALSAEYPDSYTFAVATFSDSVVYEVMSWDESSESGTFQRSYAIGEDGAVTFGDPKSVDVVEVVIEKSGGVEALEAKGGSLEKLKEIVAEGQKGRIDALLEKAGRVLSVKNADRLQQAKSLIDEVISSGDKPADEEKEEEGGEEKETSVEVVPTEPIEVSTEKAADLPVDLKAAIVAVQNLADQLAKRLGEEIEIPEEEASGEKATESDVSTYDSHGFVSNDDSGTCQVCGLNEDADIHDTSMGAEEGGSARQGNDASPDDAGAGSKVNDDAVKTLLADLEEEFGLADSFLEAE